MALRFEEIEDIVFDSKQTKDIETLERVACGELKYLLQEYQKGHITREQATQAKIKLKEKYELCLKHDELINLIKNFILRVQWDFKNNKKYIDELLMNGNSIIEHPDVKKKLTLYDDFVFDTVRYFDNQLSDSGKFAEYRELLYKPVNLRTKEENKKVGCYFTQYCFFRIGYEPGNEKIAEILMDMPMLWTRLLDLMELGEGEKIDTILEGMKQLYKSLKCSDQNIHEK